MKTLQTERLVLRPFTPNDVDELFDLYSDADVMKYISGHPATTIEEAEAALQRMLNHYSKYGFGMWAVIQKADSAFMGRCGVTHLDNTPEVELGYTFKKRYWSQGFATEASLAAVRFAFEDLGLERLVAIAQPENIASQRVMQKVGMIYERTGHYYGKDVVLYSMGRPADLA